MSGEVDWLIICRWSARMHSSTLALPTRSESVSPTIPRRERSGILERKLSDLPSLDGLASPGM